MQRQNKNWCKNKMGLLQAEAGKAKHKLETEQGGAHGHRQTKAKASRKVTDKNAVSLKMKDGVG